ncbi:alpha/beta fold hydrolase [Paramicrobacterium agarici]|uniref:alpha/beta fold hydrolase n=1 Tax=Paramicrobacterium agarici TaxID=630514 RepID=UPI001153BF17|nr:alpha/beta hydrolase [Microbacterium agarici]TQO23166.1 alpha-beta hydrolase superfamily lysophospholipase [Microbacterium agarici]
MTEFVTSADGTPIAYDSYGSGPAVILIAGAMQARASDATTAQMAEMLAERGFTVINYDRRGRGESGPVKPEDAGHELQREIDDIAALIDAAGSEAALFGNSSGGSIALWATNAGLPISRLALWEVPFTVEDSGEAEENVTELRNRIAAGRNEAAVEYFMRDMPPAWLEGAKSSGAWPGMVALAPSLVADAASIAIHDTPRGERWPNVTQPTLAMVGTETLPIFPPAAELIVSELPNARLRTVAATYHQWDATVMAGALAEEFGQ